MSGEGRAALQGCGADICARADAQVLRLIEPRTPFSRSGEKPSQPVRNGRHYHHGTRRSRWVPPPRRPRGIAMPTVQTVNSATEGQKVCPQLATISHASTAK